jgi:hypothetical protein
MRTLDECQVQKRSIASLISQQQIDPTVSVSECQARDRAVCSFVVPTDGRAYNTCATDAPSCETMRTSAEAKGSAPGACIEFPSSRRNLPAVTGVDFHMSCFRDKRDRANADCQPTPSACEDKAKGLVARGFLNPLPWNDGAVCETRDKVVCYPQLQRVDEQVVFICTSSFEECQARASQSRGPDFQVVGECAVVTGNKPW